jgi:hypothetical protein
MIRELLVEGDAPLKGLFGSTPIHMDWRVSIPSKSKSLPIRINALQYIWIENNRISPKRRGVETWEVKKDQKLPRRWSGGGSKSVSKAATNENERTKKMIRGKVRCPKSGESCENFLWKIIRVRPYMVLFNCCYLIRVRRYKGWQWRPI